MARPLVVALLIGLGLTHLVADRLPALAQEAASGVSLSQGVVYGGPAALLDPNDPLQGLRWTLGLTLPRRTRLMPGRTPDLTAVEYDLTNRRVILSYRVGTRDILPPVAFSETGYTDFALRHRLRQSWIVDTKKVLAESKARADDGGLNVALPFELPFTRKIFGEGAPNLRVSGNEQITISGSSSWVVGQVTGERGGGSLFPKLDMRQRLNVNLQGTIGSKLFVDVSQNSEALTPLENSIKIRYRGEEDEIVQSVELGNTNLSLPPTQYISYSTRQEGLFGVKATGQVGPWNLTAIASRQEGETGSATFVGGSQERVERIHDYEYMRGKFFFLADPDSALVPTNLIDVRLYLNDYNNQNDAELGAQLADVWLDPTAKTPTVPVRGRFHLLVEGPNEDYVLLNAGSESLSIPQLQLNTQVQPNQTLAVAYRFLSGPDTVDVGTFNLAPGDSVLDLKMLRPAERDWDDINETSDLRTSRWAPTRRLEFKNAYYLKTTNIDPGTFELVIVQDIAGEGGDNPFTIENEFGVRTSLIEVLGLDQKNNADVSDRTPDGRVDPEYVDYENGILFFPDLRPFDPSLVDIEGNPQNGFRSRSWPRTAGASRPDTLGWTLSGGMAVPSSATERDKETVPEIYDLLYSTLTTRSQEYHIYTIEAKVKSASASTIQLNTFGNILEGSETVRLNGNVLTRGADYNIFYDSGTINLKHPDATAPDADLVITYSYDPLFSRGSRSLLGGSVATRVDPTSKLSFSTSWLHESQGTADRRPRLGQEPTKTTVGDVSGKLTLEPWAITDLVDALPLVSTTAPSRVEVSGALGVSLPDPNTRNVVYVDDMEGAEVVYSPGVSRGVWFYSSPPRRAIEYLPGQTLRFYDPQPQDRGQLLWFSPNTVEVKDITPREDSDNQRDDLVPVLEVIYIPQAATDASAAWGGLVTSMSRDGIDVSRSQYLEIWVNDYINHANESFRSGEILIDVGSVSEDAVWDPLTPPAPPNGALDYEDRNQSEDQIETDEDTGLDQKKNSSEPPYDPAKARMTSISPTTDPAGDDRVRDIETNRPERTPAERILKYRGINGTEDNDLSDGEDLNGDFLLDTQNNYFEYRVDLAAPAFQDVGRDFGVTDSRNGWRLYRIPLDEYHLEEGVGNLSRVEHMRVWFRGVAPGDTLDVQIASIEIVGNRWEAADSLRLAPDELFNVSVVNNKENPEYTEPFGVERISNVKEREQSISLDFENFRDGNELRAFRRLADVQDYTLYQNLAFYLNPRFQTMPADSVEFYLRFSSDASNDTLSYYEVSTVLSEDDIRRRDDRWIDLRFKIADLSRLKIGTNAVPADSFLVGPGDTGPHPRANIGNGLKASIRGTPSFSRVRRISVGIRNISGRDLPQGSLWFNELRMGDVRRDRGYASRAAINLRLADLATLGGSVDLTSADFLRLGQTRGTGTENLRYDLRGEFGLHKFVERTRLNIPLSLSMSKSRLTPKFRPNSDVLFDGSESGREISQNLTRRASLTISRTGRGSGLAFYTIDAVRLTGSASETFSESVTRSDSTYQRSGSASYNLSLAQWSPLTLLGRMDFWLWPRSLQATVAGSRSRSRVWTPEANNQLRLTNNSLTRNGTLNLGANFQVVKGLVYSWNSTRDLIDGHFGPDSSIVRLERPSRKVLGVDIGREVTQAHNVTFNYTPPFMGQSLRPRFTWSSGSTQNYGPGLTLENYERSVFSINNNNSGNLSLAVPLNTWVEKIVGRPDAERATVGSNPRAPKAPRRRSSADTTGTGQDEDIQDNQDKKGSGNQLRRLLTRTMRFQPVQLAGTLARRSAYERVNGTPPLEYRLGLTRDIGLGSNVSEVNGASLNQTQGQTVTVRGNTSVTLFQELGLDFTYQKRRDKTASNIQVRVQDDTTWPEVRFNWGDIHKKIPILKSVFSEFQAVSTNYSKVTTTSGPETNPKETVTVSTNWRPLISLQGQLGAWRTTLAANRSNTLTTSRRLGAAGTTNERSQNNYQLSFNRTFQRGTTGRSIDLKIDLTYGVNSSETKSTSGLPRQDKRETIRLNSSAGIKLTRTMSGTFGLELGQERRPTTDYTRRSVRVFFSTGFSF